MVMSTSTPLLASLLFQKLIVPILCLLFLVLLLLFACFKFLYHGEVYALLRIGLILS